jgi:hypothetical protein
MTYPPQGSDEPGGDAAAPPLVPGPTPSYGPPPGYAQNQPYGQPPPYGRPQPYAPPPVYGQPPQYGPAPYGLPVGTAEPQPKSKVGLIALLTGLALLVIAGIVVLVMTLQSTVLDAASAERDVAAQFEQSQGVAIDLDCPSDMEIRTGATYTCTGKTADGESVTLRLTITDARTAAYTWTER